MLRSPPGRLSGLDLSVRQQTKASPNRYGLARLTNASHSVESRRRHSIIKRFQVAGIRIATICSAAARAKFWPRLAPPNNKAFLCLSGLLFARCLNGSTRPIAYRGVDVLRRDRRAVEFRLERTQRVGDGVGDHRRRRDRAAFADALDAERIERRRRVLVDDCYRREG